MTSRKLSWPNRLGITGLVISLLGLVVAITTPEIRRLIGLEEDGISGPGETILPEDPGPNPPPPPSPPSPAQPPTIVDLLEGTWSKKETLGDTAIVTEGLWRITIQGGSLWIYSLPYTSDAYISDSRKLVALVPLLLESVQGDQLTFTVPGIGFPKKYVFDLATISDGFLQGVVEKSALEWLVENVFMGSESLISGEVTLIKQR